MPRKRPVKPPSLVYPVRVEGLARVDPTSPDFKGTYTPPAEYRVSPPAPDVTLAEFQAMSASERKALPLGVWSRVMVQSLAQDAIRKVMRQDAAERIARKAKRPQPPR